MGWWQKKRGKDPSVTHFQDAVVKSFSHLREDMELQKRWIAYLNHLHSALEDAHGSHRELTEKDLADLKRWITHLHSNAGKHEVAILAFEKNLGQTITAYNKVLVYMHRQLVLAHGREKQLRKDIIEEVSKLLVQHKAELTEHIRQSKPREPEREPEHSLSRPEHKLLNLMLTLSDPVSYSLLSGKTGNSINTVRVIMNSLKKRALVEEHILPSGVKLFNAVNRERIKKLYNL